MFRNTVLERFIQFSKACDPREFTLHKILVILDIPQEVKIWALTPSELVLSGNCSTYGWDTH